MDELDKILNDVAIEEEKIYLSVAVKQLQDKVFPDPNIMIPLMGQMDSKSELEYNIRTLLNNALIQAIQEQENQ